MCLCYVPLHTAHSPDAAGSPAHSMAAGGVCSVLCLVLPFAALHKAKCSSSDKPDCYGAGRRLQALSQPCYLTDHCVLLEAKFSRFLSTADLWVWPHLRVPARHPSPPKKLHSAP